MPGIATLSRKGICEREGGNIFSSDQAYVAIWGGVLATAMVANTHWWLIWGGVLATVAIANTHR